MSTSGDAAEQVVRLSLEGMEYTLRVAGTGSRQIAALLYALAKDQTKTRGKTRLTSMLRSGEALSVFTVKNAELRKFQQEAKRYGVLYCALRSAGRDPDGVTDVMVRASDAAKINRIVERFKMQSTVDVAAVRSEIEKERAQSAKTPAAQERAAEAEERVVDELLAGKKANPTPARTEPASPSGSSSERSAVDAFSDRRTRPSVRGQLAEIRRAMKAETDRAPEREPARKKAPGRSSVPPAQTKKKRKRMKEREV